MNWEEAMQYEVCSMPLWLLRLIDNDDTVQGKLIRRFLRWRVRRKFANYQAHLKAERTLILTGKIKG